jgi:putative ATPase
MSEWHATHDAGGTAVRVVEADITTMEVDVVVNAANERLAHGGGVAAALAAAGGSRIQRDSDAWVREHGPVQRGQAAVTTAGSMPSNHIVHVVGPRYRADQDNAALLREAVHAALNGAADVGAATVALPAISAGIFGYPPAEATAVITEACVEWLDAHPAALSTVWLVGYDHATAELFATALRQLTNQRTSDTS